MAGALHLKAEDEEDLAVISSCLQDALVPLSDMRYEPDIKRFTLALNRFRWEEARAAAPGQAQRAYERIACGVAFDEVENVSLRGIERQKRDRLLELLAVVPGAAESRASPEEKAILLLFAGGGTIRLECRRLSCRLDDFGEPWPTNWQPRHRL